jgi:cold shock CspA family protein
MKEEGRDIKKIENLIEQGLAICKDATWIEKLNGLRKELLEGKAPAVKADGKKYGKIKFYNVARKFGVIEGANETHIFLSSGLSQILSTETLYELEGKAVSYILVKSRKREDSYIAVDVTLL